MPLLLGMQIIIWLEKDDFRLSVKALKNIYEETVLFVSKV